MTEHLAPSRIGLLQFIQKSTGSQFIIPVYQRNFTWSPDWETKQLLDDFSNILKSDGQQKHFLGIIIYLFKKINFNENEFLIVDGQQRVTTIFLVLLAIRKKACDINDENIVKSINRLFIFNDEEISKNKFRMKPLISDDEVFKKIINEDLKFLSKEEKMSNVYKNYVYILKYIEDLLDTYDIMFLLNCLQQFYVVEIALGEEDNPQQIFESINSKGAPLTAADLIRNFILMNHTADRQEILYLNYWKKIENLQPDSKKLRDVIRQFLAIKNLELPNKNDVYEVFKDWWNTNERTVEEKLTELRKYTEYYNQIYIYNDIEEELEQEIINFRKTSSQIPASFLMETMHLFDEGILNSNDVNKTFNIINSYLTRRWIADLNTSNITRLFPQILKSVLENLDKNYEDFNELLIYYLVYRNSGNKAYMPTNKQIENVLSETNAYSIKAIRAILETLENYENRAPVDLSKLNIEHVMPQKPNKYWKELTRLDHLDYIQKCNLIGNLTLASKIDNSGMGNKHFDWKKDILEDTNHLKLNTYFFNIKTWDIKAIEKRTEVLTKSIISIFPYYKTEYRISSEEEINVFIIKENINIRGIFSGKKQITILPGSRFPYYEKHPNSKNIQNKLKETLESGELRIVGTEYVVEKQIEFNSPSPAAGFILGSSYNGWDHWTLENGKSIQEIRKL